MKVLLLSVALLFTGAHGSYFWQQDEPKQEEHSDKAIVKVVRDGTGIVGGLLESMDFYEIAKEFHIEEKLQAAKKHADNLEEALESYADAVWKKFDQQLHEKFPTFRKNVVPIFQEFDDNLEKHVKKVVKEVVPVGSKLVAGISKQVVDFFENVENIAANSRDAVRIEVDSLRVKLQPYVDDVHAEYEKYRNDLKGELEQEYQQLKKDLEQTMEKVKEHAKPHIENLKSKFPDGKEFQQKLENFLKELKERLEKME